MSTATERYRILQNIIAQQGIEGDLWSELAKAEQMINMMEQGKMMPQTPPQPMQPQMPVEPMMGEEQSAPPMSGKYDNL